MDILKTKGIRAYAQLRLDAIDKKQATALIDPRQGRTDCANLCQGLFSRLNGLDAVAHKQAYP
jgi:hypothetical protein